MSDTHASAASAAPVRRGDARAKRQIIWSVNPKSTSSSDVLWFLSVPIAFLIIAAAVYVTGFYATEPDAQPRPARTQPARAR